MSLKVELAELPAQIGTFEFAYLLTVDDDQRPRAVGVIPSMVDAELLLGEQGNRTLTNVTAREQVCLIWPPKDAAGYSLIVDGRAVVSGKSITLIPSGAVLHRPIKSN